ncbi:hypothetical protein Tco_0140705, partial [Tanacetum coccineum]
KAGSYKCQLDEQWFDLTQDTLRDALQITPVDKNQAFSPPPTPDTLIKFVNELGYPREVINLHQDLKERTRAPVLTGSSGVLLIELTLDYAEWMWDECTLVYPHFHRKTRGIGQQLRKEKSDYHSDPNAKGTKREVFGMTIPNELINDVIRGADYYDAYLEKVAKHQRYLAGEEETEVVKKRTAKSSKQLVDEFIDEGVPAAKPRLEDTEEEILEKVLQESLTDAYPTQRGPLPPVVFRETDTGKFQPLPEVPGKGKEKVGEEQAAQVLLNLQTPKKKSPAEQYIFQRRSHVPTETAGREDSTSLYAELGLYGSDTESDEEMPSVVRSGAQDEGQAGPDPGTLDEGPGWTKPDDVA